jgi:xylulokinase
VADHELHLYLGTSTWLAAHVPDKKTDLRSALAAVPCALPGRYLLTALQATAGGNLTFLRDRILSREDQPGVPDLQTMDRMAQHAPAGSHGLVYTPWLWGERAPVEDGTLRAGLFNLSLQNDRADIVRAVLEGVAMNSRWLLAPVGKFLGRRVTDLRLVGGGASSDVWCQIYADVLGVPIKQMADPVQANARGAALIAAVALRRIAWGDIPGLVAVHRTYHPTMAHRELYEQRFAIFKRLHRRMRGVYRQLNGERP